MPVHLSLMLERRWLERYLFRMHRRVLAVQKGEVALLLLLLLEVRCRRVSSAERIEARIHREGGFRWEEFPVDV